VQRIACIIDSCVPTHSSTVRADAVRHLLDAGHARVAALGDDVGGAELARPRVIQNIDKL
jgi:hypothetical protein